MKVGDKIIEVNQDFIFKNYSLWVRARKISSLVGEVYKKDIIKATCDSENNIYLNSLIKFLEINKFISVERVNGYKNVIRVDNSKLSWWLRDAEPFNEFEKLLVTNFTFRFLGIPITKPYYIGG